MPRSLFHVLVARGPVAHVTTSHQVRLESDAEQLSEQIPGTASPSNR